ncbi:MAG: EAL domain-containing protein [Gammaproteobacteria bacterium]|nr:EAL domain-containing protein [Gammaproteobacteria bacterium]
MIKPRNKQYLYSLRIRYAVVAILFAMIILASASLAYQTLKTARHSTTDSIESRQQLQQRTRHIRDAIWQAHESLQMFLFNPQKDIYQHKIHNGINAAILNTKFLVERNQNLPNEPAEKVRDLIQLLYKLDTSVVRLIDIRTNAIEQYPSLAYARGSMLGFNSNFVTAASLAIEESLSESDQVYPRDIYHILVQLRHHWTQIISNFRMYLANRLGTFDNSVFDSQINDIESQYETLRSLLVRLKEFDKEGLLDLQASSSLEIMKETSAAWYEDYLKVKKINQSDTWRTDALLVADEIEPLLEKIWSHLLDIELAIESTAEADVGLLTRIAQYHVNALWLAAGLAILFVILSYWLLDKSVLRPLSALTSAIKAEAHGKDTHTLPNVKTLETQNLVDAFAEMRKQIHSRQNALEYQALHDSLTGLANRTLLMDRLQQGIQQCARHQTALSLLLIDLDSFKEVNDTLGHQVGDKLLEEVGNRLKQSLREIDTVARLGGDEFAILLPENNSIEASEVARKIQHLLEDDFLINEMQLYVSASIGIASYPQQASNIQDLIKFSDIAMYVAKRNRLGYAIYDRELDTHSISQLSLGSDLRNALDNDSIQLVYQPKLTCNSLEVYGIEALLRWTHPELGPIPASEAIDLAEQTGFINQLTIWIADEISKQNKLWQKQGIHLPIAINLSVYSLQSNAVIEQILSRLNADNTLKNNFIFEITESAMMVDPQHAIETLNQISDAGGQLSIDDFGTGFSSLAYLKQMPVGELKIDKSFVSDMVKSENDAIIVRSIIDLAHNLDLKVVAEGVEDKATLQLLQILNCDIVQGNYFCQPVSVSQFQDWYSQRISAGNVLESVS